VEEEVQEVQEVQEFRRHGCNLRDLIILKTNRLEIDVKGLGLEKKYYFIVCLCFRLRDALKPLIQHNATYINGIASVRIGSSEVY
jgi:hypothetical protein